MDGSIDWVDPVIGARGRVKIWRATSLYAEGDIGGFDANSDSAFEIVRQGAGVVKRPRSSEVGAISFKAASNFKSADGFGRRSAGAGCGPSLSLPVLPTRPT